MSLPAGSSTPTFQYAPAYKSTLKPLATWAVRMEEGYSTSVLKVLRPYRVTTGTGYSSRLRVIR